MRIHLLLLAAGSLVACQPNDSTDSSTDSGDTGQSMETNGGDRLSSVLAAQPAATRARYQYRHPEETLRYFEIAPGMTVVEALPGRGWYSKLLLPYLGGDGHLIGADYAFAMYPKFGIYDDERLEKQKTWKTDWPADAEGWRGDDGAPVSAFLLGSMPDTLDGTADRFLFIRALHNLARFESEGGYLTDALSEAYRVLKPGGIVGVVQHHARDKMPDSFADGSHGYLKRDFVVEQMENAGFEFVGEIAFNSNDKDQPTADDIVWRLPPTLAGSRDNAEARAGMEAIGESNRMTLKFRKPE